MGQRRRVLHQGVDTAERDGMGGEPARRDESAGGLVAADQVDRVVPAGEDEDGGLEEGRGRGAVFLGPARVPMCSPALFRDRRWTALEQLF